MSDAPPPPPFVPIGSEAVARWATARGTGCDPRPPQDWFRDWEPFHTMISPAAYYNSCSWPAPPGSVTLVEPYTEDENSQIQPIDRTVFGLASHPALRWTASMRAGEHFITRTSILTDPPPPQVQIGDPVWDQHVVTRAASAEAARGAFTPALRALLQGWGFVGHIELRPGGAVIHQAGLQPTAQGYEQMSQVLPRIVQAALIAG